MTTQDNINLDLIKKIEQAVSKDNLEYAYQLDLAQQDFFDYCLPGSVNNWTHPEAPQTQASLILAARILKPESILDFGTGLSGVNFRKYLPEIPCVSIDDSFVWINRLRSYLSFINLNCDGLYWYDGQAFNEMSSYNQEVLEFIARNPRKSTQLCKTYDGETAKIEASVFNEPVKSFYFSDVTKHSLITCPKDLLNAHATTQIQGYWLSEDKFFNLRHPNNEGLKGWNDLGKHSFIHYDFSGMRARESYLKTTIDFLDRSSDSLMYVDDYHKPAILYNGKTFKELASKAMEERGGILLNCEAALTDEEGAYGALYYFPPEKT